MKRVPTVAAAAAGLATGVFLARRRLAGVAARTVTAPDRWHSVTVNRPPGELGELPEPLAELGDAIEVRTRPAPGGRGTELAARVRADVPAGPGAAAAKLAGTDPVRHLRRALQEAKQYAEIGEVLLPDRPPTTRPTVTSKPLDYATSHGREEGRL
jgi:hypothetical protein